MGYFSGKYRQYEGIEIFVDLAHPPFFRSSWLMFLNNNSLNFLSSYVGIYNSAII